MFVVSVSDSMSFDEFVDVCRKVPVTSEDDLMKAFRKIDINGDGYISLDELYKIMTTVNMAVFLFQIYSPSMLCPVKTKRIFFWSKYILFCWKRY